MYYIKIKKEISNRTVIGYAITGQELLDEMHNKIELGRYDELFAYEGRRVVAIAKRVNDRCEIEYGYGIKR